MIDILIVSSNQQKRTYKSRGTHLQVGEISQMLISVKEHICNSLAEYVSSYYFFRNSNSFSY